MNRISWKFATRKLAPVVSAAALMTSGCGASRPTAANVSSITQAAGPVTAEAGVNFAKEADEHWAKRTDRAELEAAVTAWEKAIAGNPTDAAQWSKITRGYYLLADGYLAFEEGDDAKTKYLAMHEKGVQAGEQALRLMYPALKQRLDAGEKIEIAAAATVDKAGVPALYWMTANIGKWSNAQGFTTVLKNRGTIKANVEYIQKIDPDYFFGAADRYLGVIYAKAPAIAGGDMGKAKAHFDASLKTAPNYAATRVLWAEFFAVKAEDKDGFARELKAVLELADDVIPELTAETQIEKKKAKRLLDKMEELF